MLHHPPGGCVNLWLVTPDSCTVFQSPGAMRCLSGPQWGTRLAAHTGQPVPARACVLRGDQGWLSRGACPLPCSRRPSACPTSCAHTSRRPCRAAVRQFSLQTWRPGSRGSVIPHQRQAGRAEVGGVPVTGLVSLQRRGLGGCLQSHLSGTESLSVCQAVGHGSLPLRTRCGWGVIWGSLAQRHSDKVSN